MICFCPPNMLGSIICQSRYCVLSHFSCVWFFVTPWTLTCQAPLFVGFSKQDYWNGLLCPPPGDLPNPGMELASLTSFALAGRFFTTNATWETLSVQVRACKMVRTMPKTPAEFSDFGPSCAKNWQWSWVEGELFSLPIYLCMQQVAWNNPCYKTWVPGKESMFHPIAKWASLIK